MTVWILGAILMLWVVTRIAQSVASPPPTNPPAADNPEQHRASEPHGFTAALAAVNGRIEQVGVMRQATAAIDLQTHAIITRIAAALNHAERHLEIETFLGNDPERRGAFQEHQRRMEAALHHATDERPSITTVEPTDFPTAMAAVAGPHAAAILDTLIAMRVDHQKKLAAARERLARTPALQRPFAEKLTDLGGAALLPLVMPTPAPPQQSTRASSTVCGAARSEPPASVPRPATAIPETTPLRAGLAAIKQAAVTRDVRELFHFTSLRNL